MAQINYNIQLLFKEYFGINASIYIGSEHPAGNSALDYAGIETLPENYTEDYTSWMGTPIMFAAGFNGKTYRRFKLNGEMEKIKMESMLLPPATMFQFRRAKNIQRTNLLGSNGTVKEIYGFDDWVIDVRGLCLDEPGNSAHRQYEQLLQWEQLADAVSVSGILFTQKNIHSVAISDWNDNLVQGKSGVIAFRFELLSDEPIELTFKTRR